MTKISNQIAYIPDTDINGKDYLLGTDIDKGKNTSNFRVEDLGKHFNSTNGLRSFDFVFYQHIGVSPTPVDGQFYSNDNNTNPYLISHFIVSKKTKSDLDVYSFFQDAVAENPFNLLISQNTNISAVFYFRIESIEIDTNYIKLNVSRLFYPENKELEFKLSFNTFNFKPPIAIVATYTDEEAQDAVGNILIDSDTIDLEYDDNLPSIKATVIPGSITANELAANIPTSKFINDGADGTSTYVETDELGAVAFSNDYNDLGNLPTIPTVITNHSGLSLDDGTNPHGTTKSDVGLSNVDNTSDANKPVSIANQNALDNKQDTLTEVNFGAFSNGLTNKSTIVDADNFNITDSADTNKQKKFSFSNLKVALTSFFNGLFAKVNLDATTIISATVVINADNTKFDVNIVGKIINPLTGVVTNINKVQTGIVTTHLAVQTESYIWVNATSTIIQSLVAPTEDMFDNILGSWVLVHSNLTNINLINDFAMTTDGVGMQLNQALAFDGFRKKLNSNLIQAGTTGTRLTHTGGLAIKSGGGGILTKRPVFNLVGSTDATFRMRNRGVSEGADTQTMDVTNIDIGGVTTTLDNNKFGAHKVWKFSSSLIRVQRGQKEYANINDALTGIDKDVYVDNSNGSRNGIAIGWIIFKKGTTWAGGTDGVDYKFVDIVGGKSSGGGFIANMQSVYDVSISPHIKTILAFTLQGNTGLDTDKIFSGKNNAGTETSWIAADGTSSFGGGSTETFLQSMWQFSKFHFSSTTNYPFFGTAINGGNQTSWYNGSIASRRSHNIYTNGFNTMGTGGSGANRGFRWQETQQSQASLYEGFTFMGVISPYTVTDVTTRIGVLHTNTFTANSLNLGYTCHFEILNDKLQFITSDSSVATYGPQITILPTEWLMLFIEVEKNNNTEKLVRFKVKKVDGTLIYNEVSTTNIPLNNINIPTAYSQMAVGVITTKNTSTASEYLASIGYMGYGNEKPNFLKDF